MGWEIVIPEATVNLITNPSIEAATTGYTASNAALARVVTDRAAGVACLRVTPTSNTTGGVYYAVTLATTTTYTFSVSIKGADGIPYRIRIYDQTAGSALGTTTFTGDGTWRRYSVTATTGANTNIRLFVQKNSSASTAAFYVDAMQLEAKAYATTYCDGDQPGCAWSAGAHTSTSTRSAQSAEGGRVRDLATDYGFDVQASIGVGMPPLELIESQPAQSDGADHQRSIARARSFQLVGTISGDDRADYHGERLALIQALNPQRLATDEPVRVRYYNGDNRVEIAARYEGGLEKAAQENPATEVIGLRLRAQEDPLWWKAAGTGGGQQGQLNEGEEIDSRTEIASVNHIIAREEDGSWGTWSSGTNDDVNRIVTGLDGTRYICGAFTSPYNRIAAWDGNSFSDLNGGLAGGIGGGTATEATGMAVSPSGEIFVVGRFATAGGVTAPAIASWDGSSWTAYDDGTFSASTIGLDVAIAPDGTIYFYSFGGLHRWTGSAWVSILSTATGLPRLMGFNGAGELVLVGTMTVMDGVSISNGVAKYNGSAWVDLGDTGLPADHYVSALDDGLRLYVGGADGLAVYNGSNWEILGEIVGDEIYGMAFDSDGVLHIIGRFTAIGGASCLANYAVWNGSAFFPGDVGVSSGTPQLLGIDVSRKSVAIGFDSVASFFAASVNGVFNGGSAAAYPVFTLTGPGQVYLINNLTTGKTIGFELDLLDGEELTIDLRPGEKTFVSSFRGSVASAVLPGSDVEDFSLMPGENDISVLVDDASAVVTMEWLERHWSVDGVAA